MAVPTAIDTRDIPFDLTHRSVELFHEKEK